MRENFGAAPGYALRTGPRKDIKTAIPPTRPSSLQSRLQFDKVETVLLRVSKYMITRRDPFFDSFAVRLDSPSPHMSQKRLPVHFLLPIFFSGGGNDHQRQQEMRWVVAGQTISSREPSSPARLASGSPPAADRYSQDLRIWNSPSAFHGQPSGDKDRDAPHPHTCGAR